MEHALNRAYWLFMNSGRLCASNLHIAKAVLSRAIMAAIEKGERDEYNLAMYAVNSFGTFADQIVERDMAYLVGSHEAYEALCR
jgi:hypothetical protein